MLYKIVRHYFDTTRAPRRRKRAGGLTLQEAQEWCRNPETSSRTAKSAAALRHTRTYGPWFDGYTEDR